MLGRPKQRDEGVKAAMIRMLFAVAAVAFTILPAAAQADRADDGSPSVSTDRAGNVTRSGQTKPPSRDASPTSRADFGKRTANDEKQDSITRRICIGCGTK